MFKSQETVKTILKPPEDRDHVADNIQPAKYQ